MEQAGRLRKEDVCTFIAVGRIVGDKGINESGGSFCQIEQGKC